MKKESMRMKKDIRAYEYEELQKELERLGEKPFRAMQGQQLLQQAVDVVLLLDCDI